MATGSQGIGVAILADRVALVHRLRLASGLVLFAFVLSHLLNHAVGLLSLAAATAVQGWFVAFWRALPVTAVLLGALALHFALALWAIYRRRILRMPAWEAVQIAVGLAIPPLLAGHLVGTRIAAELAGTQTAYAYVIWNILQDPLRVVLQFLLLLVAWTHGAIGLHFWLRLQDWYLASYRIWRGLAAAVPVLALAGFVLMGREVARLADDPVWLETMLRAAAPPAGPYRAALAGVRDWIWIGFATLVAATLAARQLRALVESRLARVQLHYPQRSIAISPGQTVLEASRSAGMTHVSVCGGRARCGSCRIVVGRGAEQLPAPSPTEARVLERLGVPGGVRLACQVRPAADLEVRPLLRRPPAGDSFSSYRHPLLDDSE